jgi:hypothetical protein
LTLLYFTSCKKDDSEKPAPPKNYISELKIDSITVAKFYYDTKFRIKNVEVFDSTTGSIIKETLDLTYNSESRNTRIDYFDSLKNNLKIVNLDYDPGKLLVKMTDNYKDSTFTLTEMQHITFDHNGNENIITEFHYYQKDGATVMDRYFTFSYNSKGNVVIKKEFEKTPYEVTAQLKYITEYEYDDKSNPFLNTTFLYGYSSYSKANATTVNIKKAIGTFMTTSYSSEFEYNEDGYPTKETRLYFGEKIPKIFEFTYIKETDIPTDNSNTTKTK